MNKRILFVSAVLAAMTMSATLTSCVKDEVSSAVAADRDQHLQDKKDQTLLGYADRYRIVKAELERIKYSLADAKADLKSYEERLAKLQQGAEPLTAYWDDQVQKAESDLAAAKKKLETLQSLKGMDDAALTEEWAKASEALDTARKVWLEKNQARQAIEKSLDLRKAELEAMPAVAWAMNFFVETAPNTYVEKKKLDLTYFYTGTYSELEGELDGTLTKLFKVTDLYKHSQFEPGVSTNGYTSYSIKNPGDPTHADPTFDYELVTVQSSKIAEAIYKNYEEGPIKDLETELGKETDEASATGSLYAQLAQAKKELAEATTDLEKVNKTNAVQEAQDAVDKKIKNINSLKKELEDLKTAVAEISKGVPQDFYDAYLQDMVAYDKACKEDREGQMAWEQARVVTTALAQLSANFTGEYEYIPSTPPYHRPLSIEESIANAEKEILDSQDALFTAKENQEKLKGVKGISSDVNEDYAVAVTNYQLFIEKEKIQITEYEALIAMLEKELAIISTKF